MTTSSRKAKHRAFLREQRKRYDELLQQQNGVCAMCFRPPRDGERFHIDHHHGAKTLQVRGLLCARDNMRLRYWMNPPVAPTRRRLPRAHHVRVLEVVVLCYAIGTWAAAVWVALNWLQNHTVTLAAFLTVSGWAAVLVAVAAIAVVNT